MFLIITWVLLTLSSTITIITWVLLTLSSTITIITWVLLTLSSTILYHNFNHFIKSGINASKKIFSICLQQIAT
jgi:hypothetical protein